MRFLSAVWWARGAGTVPVLVRPHPRGQPDLGDRVAAGQLGQPGVDPVGLSGQRGRALDLVGVGDGDRPAGQLQLVMDNAGPFIDSIAALPAAVSGGLPGRPAQPVGIRRPGGDLDGAALGIEQPHIQPVADSSNPGCNLASASWW
jgi:hypothetical protein